MLTKETMNTMLISVLIMFTLVLLFSVYLIQKDIPAEEQMQEDRIIHYAGGCYISCEFKDRTLSYTDYTQKCDDKFNWKQYIKDDKSIKPNRKQCGRMKLYKNINTKERQKIEDLFKEHCSYLDMNLFSEEPYIQFPDGTTVYIEGVVI